ncbi:MAG: hypothetical protein WD512_03610, partial [Candidatus Paceibacterota bacterium]
MKKFSVLLTIVALFIISSCKKEGCTDPLATNYNGDAKKDDGTCVYAVLPSINTLECNEFSNAGQQYVLPDLGLPVDYLVNCKMQINGDLIIQPGVCIQFTSDAGFVIRETGSLNAEGTSANSIIFTGVDKAEGSWAGIFIDANDVKNKLTFCQIEYAGGDAFNSNGELGSLIIYAGSSAEISNCTISKGADFGINANYGEGDYSFVNNTITDCSYPMFVEADYVGNIEGGTYTGNA